MSWTIVPNVPSPHAQDYVDYLTLDTVNGKVTGSAAIQTVDIGESVTGTADPTTPKGTALTDNVN